MYRVKTIVSGLSRPAVQKFRSEWLHHSRNSVTSNVPTRNYASAAQAESFLNGSSGTYTEQMYEAWKKDPNSVHKVKYHLF